MEIQKLWLEIISEILCEGMKLNEKSKNTFFFDYSGHVNCLHIYLAENGWEEAKRYDENFGGFDFMIDLKSDIQIGYAKNAPVKSTSALLVEVLKRLKEKNSACENGGR